MNKSIALLLLNDTIVLKTLSADVYGNVDGIKQAAAWSVILQAASDHTVSACQKNWCIPELLEFVDTGLGPSDSVKSRMTMSVTGVSPYWIDRSRAVHNDFELDGLFLLTAPNMSGKSTLMRTILVAALLANCGLFTPCTAAKIPRYDHFFLRTSSHDIPSEGKSAFAVEMEDMRIILDDSTQRSLIMIDELGKVNYTALNMVEDI
jgi:DNA mismatch repair ATPase MutS